MKKRLHWASVVRDSTHQKKYPRKLFAKIRKILLFFSYFYPLKVFKNTFNNFSPLKLSWQLLTSNWQLSCFSSRSFLYIRFLPCDSIIRQKRATCHTEPVVIMYTRQKFSTPALSRYFSWTHNGVKEIEFTLLSVSLFFLRSSWQLNFAQKSSRLCQSNLMRIHKRLDPVVEWWFFVCKGKFSN